MLPTEISEVWMQKPTGATILYLATRYLTTTTQILGIILDNIPGNPLVRRDMLFR